MSDTLGRFALVTGANRGIGYEVARQLAEAGVRVLLGSRDVDRGEQAAAQLRGEGGDVIALALDVTDEATVRAAAEQVAADPGRLDILVNNAGIFVGALPAQTTAEQMRRTLEVNVIGVVAVTAAFLPVLAAAPSARIVNVSSSTASLRLTADGADLPGDATRRLAYASSKAALNMLTIQYARAFRADPALAHITINSATPGYTATSMNDFQGHRSVQQGARRIVELALLPDCGPSGTFSSDDGPIPW